VNREPLVYLASASPRRGELLEQIRIPYERLEVDVAEVQGEDEAPEVFVLRMALAKARAGWLRVEDDFPVLGADTVVVIEGEVLGKPRDRADALAMLERLSGTSHHVLTGVALAGQDGHEMSRLSVSTVTFRALSPAECEVYWETGEPADKAGAYAIQGRGGLFVERLEGSYSGVMGLPLFETGELLAHFGIPVISR
jgi:septum formation protein